MDYPFNTKKILLTLFTFFVILLIFPSIQYPVYSSSTRQNYYAESTTESTWNTNTTYQDKTVLTFTPDANSTYLIVASWLFRTSVELTPVNTRFTRTSGTPADFSILSYAAKDAGDYISGGGVAVESFGASPTAQTYKIVYQTTNTAAAVSIKEAKIVAIKLTSKDQYAEVLTRTQTNSTTFVDKTTLTFTPPTAGDYIILAFATGDGQSCGYDFDFQLDIDGIAYDNTNLECVAPTDRYPWSAVKKVSLDATSHTIKIQYASESTSTSRKAGAADARIVALRVDEFYNNYFAETLTRSTTTSTTYQTQNTLTATPLATDHLTFADATLDGNNRSLSSYAQLLRGTTSYGEMEKEAQDVASQGDQYFLIKKELLTNTSLSWYLQYRSETTSATAGIKDAKILILELTSPDTVLSTTGTQVSSISAGTTDQYIGGAFQVSREKASTSITSIKVSNTGTISSANLSNLELYYKQETTCSSSIPGDATLFNSTPGSFSSGSSTVTGTMPITTSNTCIYAQLNVESGASSGDTIEIQITNPSTDILVAQGLVSPATAVAISGTTTVGGGSNSAPVFTSFNNLSEATPGSTTMPFTTISYDPDGEDIKLVVCKTAGITGTECDGGASDTYCTSSYVVSNPYCYYAVPAPTPDLQYNVYPYIFDERDLQSNALGDPQPYFNVVNVAPIVSAVTINAGNPITLQPGIGVGTRVDFTATVTDNNSCYGSEISLVETYVYRSGIGYSGCDTAGEKDANYCIPQTSCVLVEGSCTGTTDASANYTCYTNMESYTDPTDIGTPYASETWKNTVLALDDDGLTDTEEVSTGVELNSVVSFSITPSINYGALSINQSNDPLDRLTTITPNGNVGLDQELSGSANMCTDFPTCAGAKISIGYQKYSLSASTAYSSGTVLTTTPTISYINVPKPINNTPTTKSTWWGILVPTGTYAGSYTGNISITGVKSDPINW